MRALLARVGAATVGGMALVVRSLVLVAFVVACLCVCDSVSAVEPLSLSRISRHSVLLSPLLLAAARIRSSAHTLVLFRTPALQAAVWRTVPCICMNGKQRVSASRDSNTLRIGIGGLAHTAASLSGSSSQ